MITLIITFLVAHIGVIGGALFGLGGFVFGAFRHQQAKTATAEAASTVAAAKSQDDQANAAASAATTQAVVNRSDAVAETAAIPDADLDAEGAKLGILRKD